MSSILTNVGRRVVWVWCMRQPILCMDMVSLSFSSINLCYRLCGEAPRLIKMMRARCLAYAKASYPKDLIEARVVADVLRAIGAIGVVETYKARVEAISCEPRGRTVQCDKVTSSLPPGHSKESLYAFTLSP